MDFSFTDEQQLLRENLRSFLGKHYSFAQRRSALRSPAGWQPQFWTALASELGILAMSLPERAGGLQCGPVDTMVVMEELGRALVIEPYLETVVMAGGLLARAGGARADQLLTRIGTGQAVVVCAWAEARGGYGFASLATRARREAGDWVLDGAKAVVMGAPWASHLLIVARTTGSAGERRGLSIFLVAKEAPGVSLHEYPTIDGRRAADVLLASVRVPAEALIGAEGEASELLEATFDAAIAASCAEAVGVLSVMQHDTVEYTKQRRQFGQPIANFQALQHRMVDMYMAVQMAQSASYLTTLKLGAAARERALAASAAKVTVGKACRFVGQNAIQLHGGMGMTDELAVTHYFKRATVIEMEFGSVDYHLTRHAGLMRSAA